MSQLWRDVTFLHWSVDAETVQRRLPDGLTVDTIDGLAWVGLVPFHMVGIAPRGIGSFDFSATETLRTARPESGSIRWTPPDCCRLS